MKHARWLLADREHTTCSHSVARCSFCRTTSERSNGWGVASATGAPLARPCYLGCGRRTISQAPSWLRRSVSASVKKSCCTSLFFSVTMSRCPCGACSATIATGTPGAPSSPPSPPRPASSGCRARQGTKHLYHHRRRSLAAAAARAQDDEVAHVILAPLQPALLSKVLDPLQDPAAGAAPQVPASRLRVQSARAQQSSEVQEGDACRQGAPLLVLARPRYLRELSKELPQGRRLEPSDRRRADRHARALLKQRCGCDTAAAG